MPQAEPTISQFPSPIELLWKQYEAAASEKARVYALFDEAWALTGGGDAAADAACDRAEAAADAAYDALENVADAILRAKVTLVTDLTIKARVLATRGVKDVGFYRPEDVFRFFADVQTFAALCRQRRRLRPPLSPQISKRERIRVDAHATVHGSRTAEAT